MRIDQQISGCKYVIANLFGNQPIVLLAVHILTSFLFVLVCLYLSLGDEIKFIKKKK